MIEKRLSKSSRCTQSLSCIQLFATSCSPPGSSLSMGIFQARILEWVTIFFSRGSSCPRGWTWVSHALTRKTIALTIGTFVGKEMSHLFNMLSRFVIAFLQRSKHLWISWLKSPFKEILQTKKIKSVTVSIVSPSICPGVMDRMPWSSFFECWVLNVGKIN